VNPLTSLDSGGFFSPSGTINPASIGSPITISATAYPTATVASPTPGFNWTSFLTNLVNQAGATARADIAPLSVLPRGSTVIQSPYGSAVTVGGAAAAANPLASQLGLRNMMSSLTGMLPILLIMGGVVLVISMAGGKK
jgi:hypothetical protein